MTDAAQADLQPKRRWYVLTPGRLVVGLIVVELGLLAADRFSLFGFGQGDGWNAVAAVALVCATIPLGLLWLLASLLLKRPFQFGIGTLLLLTAAAAIACSWFACKRNDAQRQKAAVKMIEEWGGWVMYDYQFDANDDGIPDAPPPGPAWFRNFVGLDFLADVVWVYLAGTQVSDAGLEHLEGMTKLEWLSLWGTQVSDEGVEKLRQALPNCDIRH